MGLAIFSFFAIFLLAASAGLLLFYREAMLQRLQSVIDPASVKAPTTLIESIQQSGLTLHNMVESLEKMIPKSQAEVGVAQQRLIRAGYRTESALKFFYGTKILIPTILCLTAFGTGIARNNSFFIYVACLGIGYLGPDFWLGRKIKTRQNKIRRGLPDVLDLLVVCLEAGLSLDQATMRTGSELERAHPTVCDELNIVVLEQRAGRPRSECWKNFADRTDVDTVRSLVSVLIQSEQFGTSVAKTLRTHSDTLRTQRMQKVEEMAAKTTVKLVFPLVLFIFPSLFLVVLGPSAIMMAESFQKIFGH